MDKNNKNVGETIHRVGYLVGYVLGVTFLLKSGAGFLSFFWPFLIIIALIVVWAVKT